MNHNILEVTSLHMHSASSGAEFWLAGCGCQKAVQMLALILTKWSDSLPSFVLALGAVAVLMRIVEQKRLAGQSCLVLLITLAFSGSTSVPLKAHIQDLLLKADGMLRCSMQLCPWFCEAEELEYPGEYSRLSRQQSCMHESLLTSLLTPAMPSLLNLTVTLCWPYDSQV